MSVSGVPEEKLNLDIALKLQKIVEQSGARVILTRSDENGIYSVDKTSIRSKKVSDMKNRVDIGNNSDADIFISIHMNYFEDSQYKGWQTFYQSHNEKSKQLASVIQTTLNENIEKNTRSPMALKGVYIMENVKIPSVIVECGFLSNLEDLKRLQEESYQNKIAWGIYTGIQKYFMEENNDRR